MKNTLIESLAINRIVIGYLGERSQFGWWQSLFFTQGSAAFLSPLFGRTQVLAQCNGVTQAAAITHDEHIGVGNVYHLFRLPEDLEQSIHNKLLTIELPDHLDNKDAALDYLRKQSIKPNKPDLGPTRVGNIESLHDFRTWQLVSGLYLYAFEKGIEIYPYFSDI